MINQGFSVSVPGQKKRKLNYLIWVLKYRNCHCKGTVGKSEYKGTYTDGIGLPEANIKATEEGEEAISGPSKYSFRDYCSIPDLTY